MRGRATKNPLKTSNIWHLVTLEPEYIFEDNEIKRSIMQLNEDKKHINSCDYQTMIRRFDCFVGPNYETGEVESGIERISYIKPPFSKSHIDSINKKMFAKSKDRDGLRKVWEDAINVTAKTNVITDVPKECRVPIFTYTNILGLLLGVILIAAVIGGMNPLLQLVADSKRNIVTIMAILCTLLILYFMRKIVNVIIRNASPKKSIESMSSAILKTMKEIDLINDSAHLIINSDDLNVNISVCLKNASIHEQNIFNTAIKELLSPIDNPKYLIIKKNIFGKYDYRNSFACPSIISKTNFGVDKLKKHFNSIGSVEVVYAYYDIGKKLSLKCRKKSFITKNYKQINRKYKLTKFE